MSRFKPSSFPLAQPAVAPNVSGRAASLQPPAFRSATPTSPAPAATADTPPPKAAPPRDASWYADVHNPFREFGFLFALAFLFTRFSMVNQLIEFKLGVNTYMTYLFGIPALLIMLSTGGIQRAFRTRASLIFLGFMLWMVFVTPFSIWKGGSFKLLKDTYLVEFPLLFLIAGLAVTRLNIQRMFRAIAFTVSIMVVASFLFSTNWGDRLALAYGTVANPNDLATHILTTLPFAGWAYASDRSRFSFMKAFWIVTALGAIMVVLKTGSRGGMLAFAVMMLIALLKMSAVQRVLVVCSTILVVMVTLALAPGILMQRYLTIFSKTPSVEYLDDSQLSEAVGSSEARKNLVKASIKITLANPVFGVGPGQFTIAEDEAQRRLGRSRGAWQVTHNSYTEVSSEMGIPGLLFFLGAIFSCIFSLQKLSSAKPSGPDVRLLANTLLLSITACMVCLMFASLAYRFYVPTLIGLTSAVICWAKSPEAVGKGGRTA